MKKKIKNIRSLILVGAISIACLGLTSCMKVEYDSLPFDGEILSRRSGYVNQVTNDWIYFNLRTGEVWNGKKVNEHIKEGEQKTRMDWDLAFCGFTLRTNSGTSGPGQGGAIDLGRIDYKSITSISQLPENPNWEIDTSNVMITWSEREWTSYCVANNMTDIPWFDPNNGPQRKATDASHLLSQAIKFSGPPPVYLANLHTYVVRTADSERYFKLQLVSWFDPFVQIGDTGGRISYYCDELN